MIPIIMNKDFERITLCEDFSSFIWISRYYSVGDFEIVVPADQDHTDLFQPGYYICRDDDINVGIIEDFSISVDEDQHEQMIVTGRFLPCILGRRIIYPVVKCTGTVPEGVKKLIDACILNPSMTARKISNFTVRDTNFTEDLKTQYTGKNLLETIEEICQSTGIGFNIILENGNFVFYLYKGTDRSYAQSENPWVVFSDEYDNLVSASYERNSSSQITDVLTAGSGEGENRLSVWSNLLGNKSGLDRYEAYNDQRNVQYEPLEEGTSEEIADHFNDYINDLRELGREQQTVITEALEGEVYFDNIQYRTDVNIGDMVVIENKKWGVSINSRLIEVIESVDESGAYQIVPTFGA